MDLKEIGSRIKSQRKSLSISQEKLAELINVTPHYIYEIERGTKAMSLETLTNIALSLEASADYIIFGSRNRYDQISGLTDKDIELLRNIAVTLKEKNCSIKRSLDIQ